MSKRSVFTTVTALPAGISRQMVMDTLHNHVEMIDLNPLVVDRYKCKAPMNAKADEYYAIWYELKDKVQYLPGGLVQGNVTYNACFHDLPTGLQTHVYAPLGLDIKGKWSLGGSLPGEPAQPVELGLDIPKQGLYLREDVDVRCNVFLSSFVKKTLKKAHATLVDRLVEKAKIQARDASNELVNNNFNSGLRPGPFANPGQGSASWSDLSDSLSPQPRRRISAAGSTISASAASDSGYAPSTAASTFGSPDPRFVDPAYQAYAPAGGPTLIHNSHEAWRYQPQAAPGNAAPAAYVAELPAELSINVPPPLNIKPRFESDDAQLAAQRLQQLPPTELAG